MLLELDVDPNDANGNVGQLIDGTPTSWDAGTVMVARYEYDPYGKVTQSAEQLLLVGEAQIGNNPVHGNSSSGLVARLEYSALEFPSLYPQHVDLQQVTERRAFAHGDLGPPYQDRWTPPVPSPFFPPYGDGSGVGESNCQNTGMRNG